MRHSKLSLATLVCGLFLCSGVSAVGFGDPLLRSYLGQSLNVQVPVTGVPKEDLIDSCIQGTVQTIDGDVIAHTNTTFIYPKSATQSELSRSATLINFTTGEDITEPAVTLAVAVKCGPLVQRNFALLLDYPEMQTPAAIASSVESAEPMPRAKSFTEPVTTRKKTTTKRQRTKRANKDTSVTTKNMAEAPTAVKPREKITSKKLPGTAPPPADQLKISNEAVSSSTSASASAAAEKSPVDIEKQRLQENSQAEERFAAMLRDEVTASATQAGNQSSDAQTTEAQNKDQIEQQQKVQKLEMEIERLKLLIESSSKLAEKPAEQSYPTTLMVLNAVVLLVLLVLLLVVAKLWFSLRKGNPSSGSHWWNASAENPQKKEGIMDGLPLANEAKHDSRAASEQKKTSPAKRMEDEQVVNPSPLQQGSLDGNANPTAEHSPSHDDNNGATFNMFTRRHGQSIQIEELSDSTQEAEFWVSLDNPKRAIEILEPQSLDENLTMPVTLLYLLDLYRQVGDEEKYNQLGIRLKRKFNINIPQFGEAVDPSKTKYLEDYEHVTSRCCAFWNTNYIVPYLESLLVDDREGDRIGFDLSVYRDILFLISICKELDRIKNMPAESA